MSQQPNNKYEQNLRNEKMKYLLPYLTPGIKILDIGGGDGSCWNSVDIRYTVDLLDFDYELTSDSNYYRNIFLADINEYSISSKCAKYDAVCLMGILEHVDDPVSLLKAAGNCSDFIFITVPNAESFHRVLGVRLGFINNVFDLDEQDIRIGHQRVYSKLTLYKDIISSEIPFMIKDFGTSSFKFNTSSYMEQFNDTQIDAINKTSVLSGISGYDRFSGAELFAVLKRYDYE